MRSETVQGERKLAVAGMCLRDNIGYSQFAHGIQDEQLY